MYNDKGRAFIFHHRKIIQKEIKISMQTNGPNILVYEGLLCWAHLVPKHITCILLWTIKENPGMGRVIPR